MKSHLLFVAFLMCAKPAVGASVPDTTILPASARDLAIRWQFDTHG
jgi:hypothetical protein